MVFDIGGQMTWAAVVQAAASIIGFGVLIYQIMHLRRNIRGATQDRLYAHYMEVLKLLMDKPDLCPYFYEDKEFVMGTSEKNNLKAEVKIITEAIYGVIEHSFVRKRNLPRAAWKGCWEPYAYERWCKSAEVRDFFDPNHKWYTKALREVIEGFGLKRPDLAKKNTSVADTHEALAARVKRIETELKLTGPECAAPAAGE
jgi:hypothetical protein